MGRHVNLHHPGVLETIVACVFAGGLLIAYLASRPQMGSVSHAAGTGDEQAAQVGTAASPQTAPEAQGSGEGRLIVRDREGEPEPDPEPAPEPEPVEPAALPAGSTLTKREIRRAGGTDAFFWAEEIPDAVFERMEGKSYGADCTVPRSDLRYVRVLHVDADGVIKVGELVVNRRVADEVVDIFRQLYEAGYPIRKMHLVDDYDADDDRSCADDNTSAFNYRVIAGTSTLSNHAYGLAIDINTFENPYVKPYEDYVSPPEAVRYTDRSLREPYMTHTDDICYQLFAEHGWSWGGNWETPKDYQHFEKPSALWE